VGSETKPQTHEPDEKEGQIRDNVEEVRNPEECARVSECVIFSILSYRVETQEPEKWTYDEHHERGIPPNWPSAGGWMNRLGLVHHLLQVLSMTSAFGRPEARIAIEAPVNKAIEWTPAFALRHRDVPDWKLGLAEQAGCCETLSADYPSTAMFSGIP
jgi:hypothetical protein